MLLILVALGDLKGSVLVPTELLAAKLDLTGERPPPWAIGFVVGACVMKTDTPCARADAILS